MDLLVFLLAINAGDLNVSIATAGQLITIVAFACVFVSLTMKTQESKISKKQYHMASEQIQ